MLKRYPSNNYSPIWTLPDRLYFGKDTLLRGKARLSFWLPINSIHKNGVNFSKGTVAYCLLFSGNYRKGSFPTTSLT
ncbi:hypothetical protein QE390_002606 [Siphonobacter sp. SORGH_AS 1065]|nr:hypothetical protein [Siphonobacter sp. SORGH_AS_1065]